MEKKNIKISKHIVIAKGVYGVIKSFARDLAPFWKHIIEGLEECQRSIDKQILSQFIESFGKRLDCLEAGYKNSLQEHFKTKEAEAFCLKVIQSALNAEYIDKQEIFINALLNYGKTDVDEDEKLRFIDLIRYLSKVALNVLSIVYEEYDQALARCEPATIVPDNLITKTHKKFKYAPELIDSALMELKNIGLFSNVITWDKNKDSYISGARHLGGNAYAYTSYTKRFIEFIKCPKK